MLSPIQFTARFPIRGLEGITENDLGAYAQLQRGLQMEQRPVHDIAGALDGLKLLINCKRYTPESGFACKVQDIGLDSYVECLEEYSHMCPFSVRYAHSYFCKSLARVYVAKELKK
jgi:hypothetical protein